MVLTSVCSQEATSGTTMEFGSPCRRLPARATIISASWTFGTRSLELRNCCTFDGEDVVRGANRNSCFVVEACEYVSFF